MLNNIFLFRRFALGSIFFVLSCWFGYGQSKPQQLLFDHLTIEEGLSHNSVYSILQDHLGYIWIGTQNGLNRYDGYELKIYRTNEMDSLSNSFKGKHIASLFEDSQQNLWVGTRKDGINIKKKDKQHFINLKTEKAFAPLTGFDISSFFEDNKGNIWISSLGNGIIKYNPNDGNTQHYTIENSGLSNNSVFDIVQDELGTIWVTTSGVGINFLNDQEQFEQVHVQIPNNPNINGYHKTSLLDNDLLWIGTEGSGLYQMIIDLITR